MHTTGHVLLLPAPPRHAATAVLTLQGAFDISNASALEKAMSDAFDAGQRNLVFDLSQVSFLDASMLNAIMLGFKRSLRRGGRVAVVRPQAIVWQPFRLAGLDRVLPSFDVLAHALDRCAPAIDQDARVSGIRGRRFDGVFGRRPRLRVRRSASGSPREPDTREAARRA